MEESLIIMEAREHCKIHGEAYSVVIFWFVLVYKPVHKPVYLCTNLCTCVQVCVTGIPVRLENQSGSMAQWLKWLNGSTTLLVEPFEPDWQSRSTHCSSQLYIIGIPAKNGGVRGPHLGESTNTCLALKPKIGFQENKGLPMQQFYCKLKAPSH